MTNPLPTLHLHVKGEYYKEIEADKKPYEFRLMSKHWRKRLVGKKFKEVHVHWGYPKKGSSSRTLKCKWNGYKEQTITHKHFGGEPVDVFAIDVRERV